MAAGLSPAGRSSPQNCPGAPTGGCSVCLHGDDKSRFWLEWNAPSVPALGSGFRHRPNSAPGMLGWQHSHPAGQQEAQERLGHMGTVQPGLQGTRTDPSSTRPCFGFAPGLSLALAASLGSGPLSFPLVWHSSARAPGISRAPRHAGAASLCPPPADSAAVCRSCSRPRKPQAKSPHPSSGAFPSGSTGIAAFPQPGAGRESLRLRGNAAEKAQDFLMPNRFF